jgi:endoglucanase
MIVKILTGLLSSSIISALTLVSASSISNADTVHIAQSTEESVESLDEIDVTYEIVASYADGYQVEMNIAGVENTENWSGSISLPENHKIVKNYGILISEGDNIVNFSGDVWNSALSEGETVKAIFLVEGNPDDAKVEFGDYLNGGNIGEPVHSSFSPEEREEYMQTLTESADVEIVRSANERKVSTTTTDADNPLPIDGDSATISDPITTDANNPLPIDGDSATISDPTTTDANNPLPIDGDSATISDPTTTDANNPLPIDGDSAINSTNDPSEVAILNPESSPGTGKFSYGEVLQKNWLFYMANRSGPIGSDNLLEWRTDSTENDGADVGKDLSGGYFDAGDHIKFIQTTAFATTLLSWSGVDYRDSYQKAGQLDELLAVVKWSTDYLLKCHESTGTQTSRLWVQVGDANDHNFWVPPEQIDQSTSRPSFAIDQQRPGSDASAGAASALASASMLFKGVDDAYSAELLQNAIALYDFAENYLGKYSDSVPEVNPFYTSWSGYEDELVLGAVWLYRATGDSAYLDKAESYYRNGIGHIGTYTYSTDDHSYAAMTLLAKESSDPFFKEEFNSWAQNWLNGTGGVNYTEAGFAVRAEWASAPLALGSAFIMEWYNDFVEPNASYSSFAQKQLDYLLGDNPLNLSYVVGFGENYPQRVHHRGSAGKVPLDASDQPNDNLLVGALVGGPRNSDNSHQDKRNDWVTNEVGISYNAPLAGAVIQQYENYGGEPLAPNDLSQIPGIK